MFESGLACNCDLDIAMGHPWSLDDFHRGMKGVTAKRREERKEAKYSKFYSSTGEKSSVVPLVFEHFGRWGEKAETYLSSLASRLSKRQSREKECIRLQVLLETTNCSPNTKMQCKNNCKENLKVVKKPGQ